MNNQDAEDMETVQNMISNLDLQTQANICEALNQFHKVFTNFSKEEADLALVLLAFEITGVCMVEITHSKVH